MGTNRRRSRKEPRSATEKSSSQLSPALNSSSPVATLDLPHAQDGSNQVLSSPADHIGSNKVQLGAKEIDESLDELRDLANLMEKPLREEEWMHNDPTSQNEGSLPNPVPSPDVVAPKPFNSKPTLDLSSDSTLKLIEVKLDALIHRSSELERERLEIEQLRKQLQHAIDTAEAHLSHGHRSSALEAAELDQLVHTLKSENLRLNELLVHTKTEYQSLLDFIENDRESHITSSIRNDSKERERELCLEIDRLKEQLAQLANDTGSVLGTGQESELQKQLANVRNQLIEARHEAVDLRLQCNELSTRLAQFQAPTSHSAESFSWEERKQAWLSQLECETKGDDGIDPHKLLEIEKVIEQTTQEISRRDREIADLKSLLEEQSVASNGMAVGAAAIAQIVEADSLIVEERQRLKELQDDWEQKQRQAEIEMSLERAKLARERLELQERMRSIEANAGTSSTGNGNATTTERKSRGNWLSRLGLRDE